MPMRSLQDRMWADALGMLARAEQLQRQLYQPAERQAGWEPPVDVLESDAEVLIVAALPGVGRDQVEVAIEGPCVVISGIRGAPEALRTAVVHRLELPQGRFERRVPLPPGRYGEIALKMRDGCLYVGLRKMP
ncbi:MAG TPA: Hsp20/alpha crystallin family protein [Pararhizobium sp.]|nr:Hsp20/alpha crystallin family protein [Pararhizobium sp.]